MAGKPAHEPTKESRNQVSAMTSFGIPQEEICTVLGITKKTLYKYYREELDTAAAKANTKVASMLYKKCMDGDTASILFWMKTKMGWKETMVNENRYTDKEGEDLHEKDLKILRDAGIIK